MNGSEAVHHLLSGFHFVFHPHSCRFLRALAKGACIENLYMDTRAKASWSTDAVEMLFNALFV